MQNARQAQGGLNARQGQLQARLAERQNQEKRQQEALQSAANAAAAAEKEVSASEGRVKTAQQSVRAAEARRQAAEEALRAHQDRVAESETGRKKALDARSALQAEVARLRAQADVLEQAERALSGYGSGARLLLEAGRQTRLKGVRGALSSLIETPAEMEAAIAAALGESLDAVLLDPGANPDAALDELSGKSAKAALLPFANLIPSTPLPPPAGESADFLGLASDLVKAPPELRPAVDVLLGQTWVARDRSAARRLLAGAAQSVERRESLRVVTLKGEVFYAAGLIIAGQEGKGGSTLSRTRQRRELQTRLAAREAEAGRLHEQIKAFDETLNRLQGEEKRLRQELDAARSAEKSAQAAHGQEELALEKARRQAQFQKEQQARLDADLRRGAEESRQMAAELTRLETQLQTARERLRELTAALGSLSLEDLQSQVSHWTTRAAVAERAVSDAQNRQRERQALLERSRRSQAALQARLAEVEAQVAALESEKAAQRQAEAAVGQEIEALQALIEPAEAALDAAEQQQNQLQSAESLARQVFSQAEHRYTQAKIALARRQEALDSLRRRIEDDFGLVAFDYVEKVSGPTPLPLQGMVEALPVLAQIPPELEENIKRQRAQLRRMGPINPEAQTEYEEVKQRFEFLTVQVADLQDAETGVKEVIAELDLLMQREFRKTFDAVAHEFRQIFTRLFGGGSARLLLTDAEDLTNTGIDIEARLPGRREQGLSLLSGGERSLTAVALVFSLLKVSPTPFCVLDEVDAMLDEANVGRFRDLLAELAQTTQFAIITHNRNTVQAADAIYGITMGRDSASQMISLKLDEVSKVVE